MRFEIKKLLSGATAKNILWLCFDKMFRLVLALSVGAWMARYLGPEKLGKLNYVQAYIAISIAVVNLGMDGFLVKELLTYPERKNEIMGTGVLMRIAMSIICFFIIVLVFKILQLPSEFYLLFFCLSLTFFVVPLDIIDIYFQSQLRSKFTVVSKNIAFAIGAILKVVLLVFGKSLVWFALVNGIEAVCASIFLVVQYQKKNNIFFWRSSRYLAKELVSKAWPFILSGLAVILYMRLDQIMIGNLIGELQVGIFSAAVKVTELFLFIPVVVATSFLPNLVKEKKEGTEDRYLIKMKFFFSIMFLVAICIALGITVFSKLIIILLYGESYKEASGILIIHVWSLIAIFLGVAAGQFLVIENLQKYSFYKTVIGLVVNVLLNLILIPKFGGYGAAIATLVSQFLSSVFSNAFFRKTRPLFNYQVYSSLYAVKTVLRNKQ